MNKLLLLAVFLVPFATLARDDAGAAVQRARIAAERAQAESIFAQREKACYARFGVNDCLKEARDRRRAVMADLRRQEVSLNDAERKLRGIERLRANDERAAQERERQGPAARAKASDQQKERDARAAEKSASRTQRATAEPANAAQAQEAQRRRAAEQAQSRSQREREAAENVARRQKNEKDAQERRAARAKRMAERNKPAASALPLPP